MDSGGHPNLAAKSNKSPGSLKTVLRNVTEGMHRFSLGQHGDPTACKHGRSSQSSRLIDFSSFQLSLRTDLRPVLRPVLRVGGPSGTLMRSRRQIRVNMAPLDIRPQRLVDTSSFQLVEFSEKDKIPPYAIVSHRWIDGEEVSFDEFREPREETKLKPGFLKIFSACQRARKDNLPYLWIDTCCIDKGSHADVNLNIQSMYAYYQNAHICYAYLVDVDKKSDIWFKRFADSEWFRRGWTLQELLAPASVEFFDRQWEDIGTKHSLSKEISYITTIPQDVLENDTSICDIAPFTKMSWMVGRKTTKPPDGAYCLSGLLGISMESDYDETLRGSLERLWAAFIDANPEYRNTLQKGASLFDVLDGLHDESQKKGYTHRLILESTIRAAHPEMKELEYY